MLNLMPGFCLCFCKKTKSMLKFFRKPSKKVISKAIGNFETACQIITHNTGIVAHKNTKLEQIVHKSARRGLKYQYSTTKVLMQCKTVVVHHFKTHQGQLLLSE